MSYFNGLLALAVLALCATAYSQSTTMPAATEPEFRTDIATTLPAIRTDIATTMPALQKDISSTMPATTQPSARKLKSVVVSANDVVYQIAPPLGATTYTLGKQQIDNVPGGDNASFQQVLLRAPGVVPDSFGQEHVRGEHGNLTYRVNGVILPEALSGFGQEIDTHLIDSVTLIDGSLPAQFGFHTAGIVDVTTKSGESLNGSEVSLYGGSFDTFNPSFETGGSSGKWDYFFSGSYTHNSEGIENPTTSFRPIHDDTDQQRLFAYLNYHIDDSSRISLLLNGSYADFQIPDTAGVAPVYTLAGVPFFDSKTLNETQNEQNYYSVLSYQHTVGDLSYQASAYTRFGQIQFTPDTPGDLIFTGVAGNIINSFVSNGVQFDGSYIVNDDHTLRAGLLADYTYERLDTNTDVFQVDPATGDQLSDQPINIVDDTGNQAITSGIYVQDEWKLNKQLTFNYGLRYDRFDANFDHEDQVSPRANFVWKLDDQTTTHFGYARYFVTPPLQNVQPSSIEKFVGTTNAPLMSLDDPAKVERSDYFDVGVTHQMTKTWDVGLDGFYKLAHNLIDEGQFGSAVIETPFNYRYGTVYGAELSTNYKAGGFTAYGNFSWVLTSASDIDSQEFEFDPAEYDYIQTHNIHLDHESEFTVSAGISYQWTNDRVYVDLLYGSGLRSGFANINQEPNYYPVNIGYEHVFHPNGAGRDVIKLRADITNIFDETYQIRNGSGVGVGAPQYGARRGIFVGLAYDF